MKKYAKYECYKADVEKRKRLADLCFFLAEAWVKQNAYGFGRSKSMFNTSLYQYQDETSVKEVVFEYSEETQMARVRHNYNTQAGDIWGEYAYADWLYFPLWVLKKAAKEGVSYVSWRLVQ